MLDPMLEYQKREMGVQGVPQASAPTGVMMPPQPEALPPTGDELAGLHASTLYALENIAAQSKSESAIHGATAGAMKGKGLMEMAQEAEAIRAQMAMQAQAVVDARQDLMGAMNERPQMPQRQNPTAPGLMEFLVGILGAVADPDNAGQMLALPFQNRLRQNDSRYEEAMRVFQNEQASRGERIQALRTVLDFAQDDERQRQGRLSGEIEGVRREEELARRDAERKASYYADIVENRDGRFTPDQVKSAASVLEGMYPEFAVPKEAVEASVSRTKAIEAERKLKAEIEGEERDSEKEQKLWRDMDAAKKAGDPVRVHGIGTELGLSPESIGTHKRVAEENREGMDAERRNKESLIESRNRPPSGDVRTGGGPAPMGGGFAPMDVGGLDIAPESLPPANAQTIKRHADLKRMVVSWTAKAKAAKTEKMRAYAQGQLEAAQMELQAVEAALMKGADETMSGIHPLLGFMSGQKKGKPQPKPTKKGTPAKEGQDFKFVD